MTTPSKKAHQEALVEFRKKHFEEMEINLTVAKGIRDNSKANAKDRNEAIKIISRMLGSLVPEKIEPKSKAASTEKQKELTPKEKAEVESLLES